MKTYLSQLVSEEQKEAFRKDKGYKAHFNSNYQPSVRISTCDPMYTTSSFGKIYDSVRDYYDSRSWN